MRQRSRGHKVSQKNISLPICRETIFGAGIWHYSGVSRERGLREREGACHRDGEAVQGQGVCDGERNGSRGRMGEDQRIQQLLVVKTLQNAVTLQHVRVDMLRRFGEQANVPGSGAHG